MGSGRRMAHICARTGAIVVIAVVAAAPLSARAAMPVVIHDQRGMIMNETANAHIDSCIGGAGSQWGTIRDQQACDDFTLDASWRIVRITVDFISAHTQAESPILIPADGFLVEFFPDIDGTPSESPMYAVVSHAATNLGQFAPPPTPWVEPSETGTMAIELPGPGASLGAGAWWISVTAVDETPFGQLYKWMGQQHPLKLNGNIVHSRAGGVDHANGYSGIQSNTDWLPVLGQSIHSPAELSFTLEGFEIPSADIDGDGVVGSADLAAMLGQWGDCGGGAGGCPADLDGDGAVGSADLALLLGAWGSAG